MNILIDECVPVGLSVALRERGYKCDTVRDAGYGSKKNGELLALAEGNWDVFLTVDKNIKHQQNVSGRKIGILILRVRSNRLPDVLQHLSSCVAALKTIRPGEIVEIRQA
jgi:predicted nuclease of predicted toxin-antitoxin system